MPFSAVLPGPVRRTVLLALALTGQSLALKVGGTTPPWTSGASFQQGSPQRALAALVSGQTEALLSSLPLPPTPAGAGRLLFVPVGVYAVTVAYNLPGVDLQLDLTALCGLLGGEIRMWNDPQLARLNPGLTLPALPVLASSLTTANAASLTLARSCVGAGQWPQSRLKASWEAGAAYLRPELGFLLGDLKRPGALAVLAPQTLPRGVQVARLRAVGGDFVTPGPQLGLDVPADLDPAPPQLLPSGPALPLAPVNLPGVYPLRGLIWAAVFQDQAYRGRSVQDARDLLAWLERLRASSDQTFAAIPPAFRQTIRLYYGGQPLTAP